MLKKVISAILVLTMCFSLAACSDVGTEASPAKADGNGTTVTEAAAEGTETAGDSTIAAASQYADEIYWYPSGREVSEDKRIVKHMTAEQLKNMAAAYIMGGPVNEEDLQDGNITPAAGEDDLHVVISYNSVAGLDACWDTLTDKNVNCINPVNWKTDDPRGVCV